MFDTIVSSGLDDGVLVISRQPRRRRFDQVQIVTDHDRDMRRRRMSDHNGFEPRPQPRPQPIRQRLPGLKHQTIRRFDRHLRFMRRRTLGLGIEIYFRLGARSAPRHAPFRQFHQNASDLTLPCSRGEGGRKRGKSSLRHRFPPSDLLVVGKPAKEIERHQSVDHISKTPRGEGDSM
jgi:hypothetical protein